MRKNLGMIQATELAPHYYRAGRHAAATSAATTHSAPQTTAAVFQPASSPDAPSPPPLTSATTSATPAAPPRYRAVLFAPLPIPAFARHRLEREPPERGVDESATDPEDDEARQQ